MSWASLLKKDKKIEPKTKDNTINFKKLNSVNYNKSNQTKKNVNTEKKIEEKNITNKNKLKVLDENLGEDPRDQLFNNYQKYIFKECNNLDYLNSCDTYHFFMTHAKPIIYSDPENDLRYDSESDYYSE